MNVLGKVDGKILNGIGSVIWVDVWHVINSRKLSINTCRAIENREVLINSHTTPVGYKHISRSLLEIWQGIRECEEDIYLRKGQWRQLCVWAVRGSCRSLTCWGLAMVVNILLSNH